MHSFVNYPHEWCPNALYSAAKLTLDRCLELSEESLTLKDASPFNVVFEGSGPVFVDDLSVIKRHPNDPTWLPFSQFVRSFINPLAANQEFKIPLKMIYSHDKGGLTPEQIYKLLGPFQKFSRKFFGLISVPTWLGKRGPGFYPKQFMDNPKRSKAVHVALLKQLKNQLQTFEPTVGRPKGYARGELAEKENIIKGWLSEITPKKVLDVGCGDGYFSQIACELSAKVVGIDSDEQRVSQAFNRSGKYKLDLLPLVVDIAQPTPAMGWANQETLSFVERSQKQFDLVLMLDVIHHLLVRDEVPLEKIVNLMSSITKKTLIVEYVDPSDSSFSQLCRGRERHYDWLNPQSFVQCLGKRFKLVKSIILAHPTRRLYHFELI